MDYLCKLIESNKNTCIVNRCLPLNYREISWMHLSSIWNVKCRKKNLKNRLNFFCLFSVLLCFSFFRLLFSFCSIWKRSIVFLMLPSSLVHPCFLLFLVFLCSFLDMKSNETNNTSQCQHGFKCVQLFKIPYFFCYCSISLTSTTKLSFIRFLLTNVKCSEGWRWNGYSISCAVICLNDFNAV